MVERVTTREKTGVKIVSERSVQGSAVAREEEECSAVCCIMVSCPAASETHEPLKKSGYIPEMATPCSCSKAASRNRILGGSKGLAENRPGCTRYKNEAGNQE